MLSIGLTGGIGSGKSTVAAAFHDLGVPVYNADLRARDLINTDPSIRKSIEAEFGKDIYKGKILDRKKMASIVFKDKKKLKVLNSIVHPGVRDDYRKWLKEQDSPYVIREAAILLESGAHKDCDMIILVLADEEIRIRRVMDRDGISRDEVLKRITNQWDDSKKADMTDYFVLNNGTEDLHQQILKIHNSILRKSKRA